MSHLPTFTKDFCQIQIGLPHSFAYPAALCTMFTPDNSSIKAIIKRFFSNCPNTCQSSLDRMKGSMFAPFSFGPMHEHRWLRLPAAFGAHAALTGTTMNATKIHLSYSFSARQPNWPRLLCLPPSPAPPWLPESNRAPRLSPRIGQRRSPRPTDPSDELVYDDGCLNLRGSLWPHGGSQPPRTIHDEA